MQEIARDLMKDFIQQRSRPLMETEASDDWSGLRRAAAYFDKQPSSATADGVGDCDPEVNAGLEDPTSWLRVLTEEQVAVLVHELLNEKIPSGSSLGDGDESAPSEQALANTGASEPTLAAVGTQGNDQGTGMAGFLSRYVQMVADKEVQVEDNDGTTADSATCDPTTGVTPGDTVNASSCSLTPPPPLTRTHLARAIFESSAGSEPVVSKVASSSTIISVLRRLRAERKRYASVTSRVTQTNKHEPTLQHSSTSKSSERAASERVGAHEEPSSEPRDDRSASSVSSRDSISRVSKRTSESGRRIASPDTPLTLTEPLKLVSLKESADYESNVSNGRSVGVASSLSSSSSSSSKSLTSRLGLLRPPTSFKTNARRGGQRRPVLAVESSQSSCRASLLSEDLSEGEMTSRGGHNVADLSDGELFGKTRDRVVAHINARNRLVSSRDSDNENPKSSAESGELLPIVRVCVTLMCAFSVSCATEDSPYLLLHYRNVRTTQIQLHSAYRQRMLGTSCSSSIESGELEEGRVT